MTFAERLNAAMKRKDVDQSELGRRLNVSSQAVNQWCVGVTQPRGRRLDQVAKALEVPLTEILGLQPAEGLEHTGNQAAVIEGGMLSDTAIIVRELDVTAQSGAGFSDGDEPGHAVLAEWQIPGDYLRSHTRSPNTVTIIRVSGDSMEPEYPSGDRVLVDTTHKVPSPPGVYVLWDGYGLVLKRLEVIQGGDAPLVRISSSNPAYPPYERRAEALAINGRVVGKWMWK